MKSVAWTQEQNQYSSFSRHLQASSYIAGLSGGSWLVGSLASNNLNSVDDMLSQGLWELTHSFLSYYGIEHPIKQVEEWVNVGNQVASKEMQILTFL